jgi:hypothetical protein
MACLADSKVKLPIPSGWLIRLRTSYLMDADHSTLRLTTGYPIETYL